MEQIFDNRFEIIKENNDSSTTDFRIWGQELEQYLEVAAAAGKPQNNKKFHYPEDKINLK